MLVNWQYKLVFGANSDISVSSSTSELTSEYAKNEIR